MLWLLLAVVSVIVVIVGAFVMYGPVVGVITVLLLPWFIAIDLILINELCNRFIAEMYK